MSRYKPLSNSSLWIGECVKQSFRSKEKAQSKWDWISLPHKILERLSNYFDDSAIELKNNIIKDLLGPMNRIRKQLEDEPNEIIKTSAIFFREIKFTESISMLKSVLIMLSFWIRWKRLWRNFLKADRVLRILEKNPLEQIPIIPRDRLLLERYG